MKTWEVEFLRLLKQSLEKRRARNPRFSIRQHAGRVGLSPGALSEVLRGKRRLSKAKTVAVLKNLETSPRDSQRLLALMGRSVHIPRVTISPDEIDVILDWIDHAVLGLFELNKPQINCKWIAKKISVPVSEIEERVSEFLERGFLQKTPAGRIVRARENWTLTSTIDEKARKLYAREQLSLAQHALEHADPKRIFFSALTFTGTQDQIEKFRQEILKLFNQISALSEEENKTDLIRFSVQAFPFEFALREDAVLEDEDTEPPKRHGSL